MIRGLKTLVMLENSSRSIGFACARAVHLVQLYSLRCNPTWETVTMVCLWRPGSTEWLLEDTEPTNPLLGRLVVRIQKDSMFLFQTPSISIHYNHSYFLFSVHHTHSLIFLIKNITNLDNHCRSTRTLLRTHRHLQDLILATYQHIIFYSSQALKATSTSSPNLLKPDQKPTSSSSPYHHISTANMQLQSILITLAVASVPILALPIVPEHSTLGVQSIELHNIHQESCLQLSQSIEALVDQVESESCDEECKTKSNETLEILRSAQNEFPCQA